jgi:hypothetical protein
MKIVPNSNASGDKIEGPVMEIENRLIRWKKIDGKKVSGSRFRLNYFKSYANNLCIVFLFFLNL